MMMRETAAVLACVGVAFSASAMAQAERSGKEVVEAQCVKCHGEGLNGAPRIGDRAAWAPRMTKGLDATVRSAIHGHGAMPARGGMADLTDREMRAAVSYMFYPESAALKDAHDEPPALADPHLKLVDGMEVRLGIVPAESSEVQPRPRGKGYYFVNVSLRDAAGHRDVRDAKVKVRLSGPMTGETKSLSTVKANGSVSYGSYFRVTSSDAYTIAVQIRRPGSARPSETQFDFRP